jgi:hypothetical protein
VTTSKPAAIYTTLTDVIRHPGFMMRTEFDLTLSQGVRATRDWHPSDYLALRQIDL